MKTLPADLEALMPRHDIRVDAFGEITATDRRPFVMGEFFTADQVREAMLAATERAAKIVESGAPPRKLEGGRIEVGERARNAFAAAIRSGGEAGS